MAYDIAGLFDLELLGVHSSNVSAEGFIFREGNHIFTVMGDLYLVYSFSVLQPVELFPLFLFLPEAQHQVVPSACEDALAVLADCYICAEFLVFSQPPVFI